MPQRHGGSRGNIADHHQVDSLYFVPGAGNGSYTKANGILVRSGFRASARIMTRPAYSAASPADREKAEKYAFGLVVNHAPLPVAFKEYSQDHGKTRSSRCKLEDGIQARASSETYQDFAGCTNVAARFPAGFGSNASRDRYFAIA